MTEESPLPPRYAVLDPRTIALLSALLAVDAGSAAAVRERSPARRRPVRQYGPLLDLGAADPPAADAQAADDGSPPTGP